MKTLLLALFISLTTLLHAQGLEESFDASCQCWTITNHYDNGQVSMVHHENAERIKHGKAVQYSFEGTLIREEQWVNGKLDGKAVSYHPDGSVYLEATYERGKKIGTWTFLDPDGTPTQEIVYNGQGADGLYRHFHAGVLYAEQTVESGKLVNTEILNQEIYDVVQEEAATAKQSKQ